MGLLGSWCFDLSHPHGVISGALSSVNQMELLGCCCFDLSQPDRVIRSLLLWAQSTTWGYIRAINHSNNKKEKKVFKGKKERKKWILMENIFLRDKKDKKKLREKKKKKIKGKKERKKFKGKKEEKSSGWHLDFLEESVDLRVLYNLCPKIQLLLILVVLNLCWSKPAWLASIDPPTYSPIYAPTYPPICPPPYNAVNLRAMQCPLLDLIYPTWKMFI